MICTHLTKLELGELKIKQPAATFLNPLNLRAQGLGLRVWGLDLIEGLGLRV